MARIIIILLLWLLSCKNERSNKAIRLDTTIQLTHLDSLLIDTPKILKSGKDYYLMGSPKREIKYFGKRFAPYKLELYDVAKIERMLDSLIRKEQRQLIFKKKSIVDFKYEIYSVVTSNIDLETRIVGFNKSKVNSYGHNVKMQENYSFYVIYDLIKNIILTFKIFEH